MSVGRARERVSLARTLSLTAFWIVCVICFVEPILPVSDAFNLTDWDKLNHTLSFLCMTILARTAYPKMRGLSVILMLGGFGAMIELTQAMPFIHRDAEWGDWFSDVLGIASGLILLRAFSAIIERVDLR